MNKECSIWDTVRDWFCPKKDKKGKVILTFGKHEIFIETCYTPCQVFLSTGCCNHQVCGADVSLVGSVIQPNGFVLFADVKANSCRIDWIAERCKCCCC